MLFRSLGLEKKEIEGDPFSYIEEFDRKKAEKEEKEKKAKDKS